MWGKLRFLLFSSSFPPPPLLRSFFLIHLKWHFASISTRQSNQFVGSERVFKKEKQSKALSIVSLSPSHLVALSDNVSPPAWPIYHNDEHPYESQKRKKRKQVISASQYVPPSPLSLSPSLCLSSISLPKSQNFVSLSLCFLHVFFLSFFTLES